MTQPDQNQEAQGPPGGATTVVLLVGLAALAIVSLASNPRDEATVRPDEALAAIEAVRAGAPRAHLTDLRREELVWYAGGRVTPSPDWMPRPETGFVAVAHEPGGLPTGHDATESRGSWVVGRYGDPEAWSWPSALASAVAKASTPCGPYRLGRMQCGERSWQWVGDATVTVQETPERCLWMHPLDAQPLSLRFPDVPAGRIRGSYALSDVAAETKGGGAVEFSVQIGDAAPTRRTARNRKGWNPFTATIPKGGADLTLEVSARRPGRRHFCVRLEHDG